MTRSIRVVKIEAKDTYEIRNKILRPHQAIDKCQYPGDLDSTTAHYGVFERRGIVGILSIYKVQNKKIDIPDSWQLRAMATSEDVRGKGYGLKLLQEAESYVKTYEAKCIWANSRLGAVGFYKRSGYSSMGDEFHIQDIGPHYLVYKKVT